MSTNNTDYWRDLGRRALALEMPWAEGLLDGSDTDYSDDSVRSGLYKRTGTSHHANAGWDDYDIHYVGPSSWPDFRDPVTEAWLVAWGLHQWDLTLEPTSEYSHIDEMELSRFQQKYWEIQLSNSQSYRQIAQNCTTRAEAWVVALERLKGAR